MMVVMLILSIIMAAFAPVMTTRSKVDLSSPWRWSSNNSDIYYGIGDSQTAMIGQRKKKSGDLDSRLIINTSSAVSGQNHILFKSGGDEASSQTLGALALNSKNSILFGNLLTGNSGMNNILIGRDLDVSTDSQNNVLIGDRALAEGSGVVLIGSENHNRGLGSISIGSRADISSGSSSSISIGSELGVSGENSIAIGQDTGANYELSGDNSILLGKGTLNGNKSVTVGNNITISGDEAVAIGYKANSSTYSTSLGSNSQALYDSSIAIGKDAKSKADTSVSIGNSSKSESTDAIAIGNGSIASGESSIAIGSHETDNDTTAYGQKSIAIGDGTVARASSTISIGDRSISDSTGGISIGQSSYVQRGGGIAIGVNSRSGATNSSMYGDYAVAIGQESKAGTDYGVSIGYRAGNSNKGTYNIAIGYNSCQYATGNNKICIGANSGPRSIPSWASDNVERVYIGGPSKFNNGDAVLEVHNPGTSFGYGAGINVAGVVVNGALVVKGPIINNVKTDGKNNQAWSYLEVKGGKNDDAWWSYGNAANFPLVTSDRRLKYVGQKFTSGLDKIRELNVYNYTFKNDEKQTPHVGVIAQDLQKVFPYAVSKNEKGFLQIRVEDMFYALLNSVKELDVKVTDLGNQIKVLQKQNIELLKQNKEIINQNKRIEARLKALEASH